MTAHGRLDPRELVARRDQELAQAETATYHDILGELDGRFTIVEDVAVIAEALRHPPGRERRVLALRFGGDLTQPEIAAQIDVSQMHVSRLLRRAVEQLRILARAAATAGGDEA